MRELYTAGCSFWLVSEKGHAFLKLLLKEGLFTKTLLLVGEFCVHTPEGILSGRAHLPQIPRQGWHKSHEIRLLCFLAQMEGRLRLQIGFLFESSVWASKRPAGGWDSFICFWNNFFNFLQTYTENYPNFPSILLPVTNSWDTPLHEGFELLGGTAIDTFIHAPSLRLRRDSFGKTDIQGS